MKYMYNVAVPRRSIGKDCRKINSKPFGADDENYVLQWDHLPSGIAVVYGKKHFQPNTYTESIFLTHVNEITYKWKTSFPFRMVTFE